MGVCSSGKGVIAYLGHPLSRMVNESEETTASKSDHVEVVCMVIRREE